MSIYMEYTSDLERELDIISRQFEIDTERAFREYEEYVIDGSYFAEASVDQQQVQPAGESKFKTIVSKIINYIIKLFNDIIDIGRDIFTRNSEGINYEEYITSSTGQMEFSCDLRKVQRVIDDEVLKGRKIIQALSKGTGIPDSTIAKYVDGATDAVSNVIKKHGKVILTTAGAYGIYKACSAKNKDNVGVVEGIKSDINNFKNDKSVEGKINSVLSGITKLTNEGLKVYNSYTVAFDKEAKRKARKARKTKN